MLPGRRRPALGVTAPLLLTQSWVRAAHHRKISATLTAVIALQSRQVQGRALGHMQD